MTDPNKPDVPHEGRYDEPTGQYTTGHSWDGIEELNTPMPRWWLGIFYLSIIFSIGYAIAMPSIPLINSHFQGVLGHSDRASVASDVEKAQMERAQFADQLTGASLETITADPDLFRFAMASGKAAFGDNCATCHGAGGQGFKGYPNLNDDIWIWGGTFADIRHTLEVGIRSNHEDTRFSLMQAFGEDEILSRDQIRDVTDYLLDFTGRGLDPEAQARGQQIFADNCASCHGNDAKGDRSQGAPNLTDAEWLYGGERDDIIETLQIGRQGVMPNWDQRLDPATVTALAVYVHALGGGEPTVTTHYETVTPDTPLD